MALYEAPGPKGAIVAFVGAEARSFLPRDLRDFELICWLKPGCTSPDALRRIKRDGATIRAANNLHAKVYWSSAGVVVTSANLSTPGLLDGGHHEVGVVLARDAFDIQRLRAAARSEALTSHMLLEFERAHREYIERNEGNDVFHSRRSRSPRERSFIQWFRLGPDRPTWKWAPFDELYEELGVQNQNDLRKHGLSEAENFITVPDKYCERLDWLLCIDLRKKKGSLGWLCPNVVSKLTRHDEGWSPATPLEAVQYHKLGRRYGRTPFDITPTFEQQARRALMQRGVRTERDWWDKFANQSTLNKLLRDIAESMEVDASGTPAS